jgi:hypothetical protein
VYLDAPNLPKSRIEQLLHGKIAVTAIPWQSDQTINLILSHIWGGAEWLIPQLFANETWAARAHHFWEVIIGEQLGWRISKVTGNYRQYFASVESSAIEWAIAKTDPDYVGLTPVGAKMGMDERFVCESTIRAVFYTLLSNVTGATYYSNAYRTYTKNLLLSEFHKDAVNQTADIFRFLEQHYWADIAEDHLIKTDVKMPFIFSSVLRGTETVQDVCERIVELRMVCEPLRAKRRELESALKRKDQAVLHALVKSVGDNGETLAQNQYFIGRSIPARLALSIGGARPVFGGLGYLLTCLARLPDDVVKVLRMRFVRPELWVITRLSSEAREMISSVDHFYKLIHQKGSKAKDYEYDLNAKTLERLSSQLVD